MKIQHWLTDGSLSSLSHPSILGSAFTTPAVNTDMSPVFFSLFFLLPETTASILHIWIFQHCIGSISSEFIGVKWQEPLQFSKAKASNNRLQR